MADFAARFYPNPVFYQIGYQNDKNWWSKYDNPVSAIGERLAGHTRQDCGIIWVDFTLRDFVLKTQAMFDNIFNKIIASGNSLVYFFPGKD
jgi:hypothetical protein